MSNSNSSRNAYSSSFVNHNHRTTQNFHAGDKRDVNRKENLQQNTPKKLTSLCQVCGDQAPEHIHYGSVSCFSCRAFFRRSVSKFHMYMCPGNKRCSIIVTTRKNCQYCRYQACLRAGMRPTWVLTDKEKQDRIKNKKMTSENTSKQSGNDVAVSKNVNTGCGKQISSNGCNFTGGDDRYIEDLLSAQRTTVCNEVFGKQVAHAITKCIQTDIENVAAIKLPCWATLEVFRVQYSRFSKLSESISEFTSLNQKSQETLLRHNSGAIAIIKLAHIFKPILDISESNVMNLKDVDTTALTTQLCEMGFENKMAKDITAQVSKAPVCLTLNQLFNKEWTKDPEHAMLHHRTFRVLSNLIRNDSTLVLLFQIINLFSTSNIGPELNDVERNAIDGIQERWTTMLQGYYNRKYGYSKGMMMMPAVILLIFELHLLSEQNCCFNGE